MQEQPLGSVSVRGSSAKPTCTQTQAPQGPGAGHRSVTRCLVRFYKKATGGLAHVRCCCRGGGGTAGGEHCTGLLIVWADGMGGWYGLVVWADGMG